MANKMSIGRYWVGMVSARSAPRANDTVPEEGHMAGLSTATKVASIAALAVLVALGARAALRAYQEREADPRLGDAYTLSVGEDESASDVARRLREDGMIRSETYFTSRVRLAGGSLESEEHELRRGMSVAEIVDAITAGDG